ncbi:hypothetical protein KJ765_04080 [Candidatus Micrarchaeota archaeon]|nr:hypothetical protein [Candidatus Micrarchaeota archaeon]
MKRHTVGFELEVFLIDDDGNLMNGARRIHKRFKSRKPFVMEVGDSMLEFNSMPHARSLGSIRNLFYHVNRVEKMLKGDGYLLPLGTYPGRSEPFMVNKPWYRVQDAVLGPAFRQYASRVCGFHFHIDLPKGAMLYKDKLLRIYKGPETRRTVISQYNFLIAADPAVSCFLQSSPFYEGRHVGKDARMLLYRDLKHSHLAGVYHELTEFGRLPRYASTLTDLNHLTATRKKRFISNVREVMGKVPLSVRNANPFNFFWGPVRINKLGTIEQRGMDANHPRVLLGASSALNAVLKRIYAKEIVVRPSDDGIRKPFKFDGHVLLVPPHSYITNTLLPAVALNGLEDARVRAYCTAFHKLAYSFQKDHGSAMFAQPFREMLSSGKTISDEILAYARKRGFREGEELAPSVAQAIALRHAHQFRREVEVLSIVAKDLL